MESRDFFPSGGKIILRWQLKMRTVFRHTLSGLISGVVLLCLAENSYACDGSENLPGQNFDLMFDRDSVTVSEEQARKLSGIGFHEKLGTVAGKGGRVAKLARWLVESGVIKADGE